MNEVTIIKWKAPITWILVADGKRAKVYTNCSMQKDSPTMGNVGCLHALKTQKMRELVPVDGMEWNAPSLKEYDVEKNSTAMVFQSSGCMRHMSEPHIDARGEVKYNFAKFIAARLNEAKINKQFDRLIIITPPRMLGDLRSNLSTSVHDVVISEFAKELTNYDGKSLVEYIRGVSVMQKEIETAYGI